MRPRQAVDVRHIRIRNIIKKTTFATEGDHAYLTAGALAHPE